MNPAEQERRFVLGDAMTAAIEQRHRADALERENAELKKKIEEMLEQKAPAQS